MQGYHNLQTLIPSGSRGKIHAIASLKESREEQKKQNIEINRKMKEEGAFHAIAKQTKNESEHVILKTIYPETVDEIENNHRRKIHEFYEEWKKNLLEKHQQRFIEFENDLKEFEKKWDLESVVSSQSSLKNKEEPNEF